LYGYSWTSVFCIEQRQRTELLLSRRVKASLYCVKKSGFGEGPAAGSGQKVVAATNERSWLIRKLKAKKNLEADFS